MRNRPPRSNHLVHGLLERAPMMKMLDLLFRLAPWFGRAMVQQWYRYLSRLDQDAVMLFMNYGFEELDPRTPRPALGLGDDVDRYCVQMYHHVAGAVDLRGRDVLEVGCGRGGGAAYVARRLGPRRVTGMDLAPNAVEFCRQHHRHSSLDFVCGDAEALPFPDESFDAVINVESSHCYGSMRVFLAEVRRVLREGGHLLLADRRHRHAVAALRLQVRQAGFEVVSERRITRNILRALDLDDERKLALIHDGVPGLWRKLFKQFAAVRGTSLYESFRRGDWEYLSFVLRKNGTRPEQ